MNEKELKKYLNVIKRAVSLIENMLDEKTKVEFEAIVEIPEIDYAKQKEEELRAKEEEARLKEEELRIIEEQRVARKKHINDLMSIDCWPESVPNFLVNKEVSEKDQINRANAVLDMTLDKTLEGLNFLDFGCGDGWIAEEAKNRGASESFGYDILKSENWINLKNAIYTNDYSILKKDNFDVIMLYDVLDHCHDPIELMGQVRECLRKDGVVYVRCHPWTSKHANHLYKNGINKSYIHLFLNYHEIYDLTENAPLFTRIEKYPLRAYHYWFSNFNISKERFIKESVSEFFFVPSFKELLAYEQKIPINQIDDFLNTMAIQFIDYKLKAKN